MTDPADNPLALFTFEELIAEIRLRCTSFVLVHDRPLKVAEPNVVGLLDMAFSNGSINALGLLQYGQHKILRGFDQQDDEEAET